MNVTARTLCLLICLLACIEPGVLRTRATEPSSRAQGTARFASVIDSRAQFDLFARVAYEGRFTALPQLMFAIDRAQQAKVYYINSKHYRFHKDFLAANYLTLDRGQRFYEQNYLSPSRRFILGSITFQPRANSFVFEFWEGDLITPELLSETSRQLQLTFFASLDFKPNSALQETSARLASGVKTIGPGEIESPGEFVPLNVARGTGVLRIIEQMTEDTIIDRNEIVIFRQSPLQLTPCAGIITTFFGTPLAHVNLLAKGWGIPNAYVNGAIETYRPLQGKFVRFEVTPDGFTLRPAEIAEIAEYGRREAERANLVTPRADVDFKGLASLAEQRRRDALRFGAKAANLGEVMWAIRTKRVSNVSVPPGFSLPFYYYLEFIKRNQLEHQIVEMLSDDRFNHDPPYRKQRLGMLRASIQQAALSPALIQAVWAKASLMFPDKGMFVRSSTNAEDLDNFSGAGLYTTVPNVRSRSDLSEAIKTVWASIWNYEAYEARESSGINHAAVYPSVLIQEGMPADAAGVLITLNPFDRDDTSGVYINAKRGLGIRVVEGQRVPEQLVYDPVTRAVKVLTRSGDDTKLTFDPKGGIRAVRIETDRRVLTDDVVRQLSQSALEIKRVFSNRDQDIEWLTVGKVTYIVQSRPYIDGTP